MSEKHTTTNSHSRRGFLKAGAGLAALPGLDRSAVLQPGAAHGRTLVLLHLEGGNDGLNTLVPYTDPAYRALRPSLGRDVSKTLPIDGQLALHPCLKGLYDLYQRGRLAIIQGVGYPEPDYSHVGSCAIWATADPDSAAHASRSTRCDGWLSRYLHATAGRARIRAVAFGRGLPAPLRPAHPSTVLRSAPEGLVPLLRTVVARIREHPAPEIVHVAMDGFDTHDNQYDRHNRLLAELDDGLTTFQADLERAGLADRVQLLAYSEFGRRPAENATGGTDHGAAGVAFALGAAVRGGLYGQTPSLTNTDAGNLIHTTDFRSVYATILQRWLQTSVATCLAGNARPLNFA